MTKETFQAAIQLAKEFNQPITIGGGEPTLHPLFKQFVMESIWETASIGIELGTPAVYMVTNGSNTDISLALAKLAKQGIIAATVSHDQYHDPIDERVYEAFQKPSNPSANDCRGINRDKGFIIPAGRAKKWGNHPYMKCACDALFVVPNGDIYPCGCRIKSIGNVLKNPQVFHEHFQGYCEKSENYKIEVLDMIAQNM